MVPNRKPRGYWGVVLAFGLACLLTGSAAAENLVLPSRSDNVGKQEIPPHSAKKEAAEERPPEPPSPQTAPNPTEISGREHDSGAASNGEEQPQQNSYLVLGDGWAQWAMAITGFLALILSGFAVWLLYRTLEETRRAIKEAETATDAAQAAVDVTRDLGRHQLRAYVTLTLTGIKFSPLEKSAVSARRLQGPVLIDIEGTLKNAGATPAQNIMTRATIVFRAVNKDDPFVIPTVALPDEGQALGYLAPGDSGPAAYKQRVRCNHADALAGRHLIIVVGEVTYDTIGGTGRTMFAHFTDNLASALHVFEAGGDFPRITFTRARNGNEMH